MEHYINSLSNRNLKTSKALLKNQAHQLIHERCVPSPSLVLTLMVTLAYDRGLKQRTRIMNIVFAAIIINMQLGEFRVQCQGKALSPAFFSQLKTALFSCAGVGSASE